MGIRPRGLASPAAESIAGRNPMALDVPHRSAQLAPDFRAAEDGGGLKYHCLFAEIFKPRPPQFPQVGTRHRWSDPLANASSVLLVSNTRALNLWTCPAKVESHPLGRIEEGAMSGNKQRRFTDEFKRGAVRLTRTSGRRVERVANDFGIAKSTLSRWRSEQEQADLL